jgi:hypothetical protein
MVPLPSGPCDPRLAWGIGMRFVHSLVKTKNAEKVGWCAPIELGESAPHYVSFVIPVDDGMDDRYICEILRGDQRNLVAHEMIREGKDSFFLAIGEMRLWFTVRPSSKKGRRLPYVGALKHADFTSLFTEIEPEEPSRLDRLCEDENVIIVGCDPFTHYSGIGKLKQGQT